MYKYAQIIMETGLVQGISYLAGVVKLPDMIPIDDDFDPTNKKWDFETETWVEYIPEPTPETPSSTEDELQWQAITDLEISQMEYNQALTDLEIKYLEGGINI